jgi:hypothetical protein
MRIILLSLLALPFLACAHTAEAPEPEKETVHAAQPESRGEKPADAEKQLSGVIAEAFDAAGYTYLRVTLDGGEDVWAAASQVEVKVGARVAMQTSIKMTNFTSKALGRTFDEIYFVTISSVEVPDAPASDLI